MIFKDDYRNQQLQNEGYIKLNLNLSEALSSLREIYQKYFERDNIDGLFVSHSIGDLEKNLSVHNEIVQACSPFIEVVCDNFEIYAAHFMVKSVDVENTLQLHQDWNNVDETSSNSLQVWIPLGTSSAINGGMGVLPRSHKMFNNYRSGSFDIPRIDLGEIKEHILDIELNSGEALFFYPSTFHCSYKNQTLEDRIVVLLNIVPKSAQNIYYHKNNHDVEVYAMNTELLFKNVNQLRKGLRPEGVKLLYKKKYNQKNNRAITARDLIKLL